MNRKKFIVASLILVFTVLSLGVGIFFSLRPGQKISPADQPALGGVLSRSEPPLAPAPRNAFVSSARSGVILPDVDDGGNNASSSAQLSATGSSAVMNEGGVSVSPPSFSAPIAAFPSSSYQSASSSVNQVSALDLPDVPDSELAISASGASSSLDYVIAFNAQYKNINFDSNRFGTVLKDESGIPLFIPSLVDKALADNNFSEVKNSLVIQKDFANADIALMKSIKVSGGAVAFDKEVVGTEELTVQLADEALAVASGNLSRDNFDKYDSSYLQTVSSLHDDYVHDMQVAFSGEPGKAKSFFAGFVQTISPVAYADVPGVEAVFGGPIIAIEPAIIAVFVTIGPPVPAEILVPDAFLATPLFFLMKSLVPGSWCLGQYETIPPDAVIMMGTSLPVP